MGKNIVVLAALAAASAITFGALQGSMQANQMRSLSNLKQIDLATIMYSQDSDDVFPKGTTALAVEHEILPYVRSKSVFISPNPKAHGYNWNANVARVNMTSLGASVAMVPAWYEKTAWPDGKHGVAYCDGHARLVDAPGWKAVTHALAKKYPKQAK